MNIISKAGIYGIKATIYLASQPEATLIPISRISEATRIPFHYLTKILQDLRRGNIVTSIALIN